MPHSTRGIPRFEALFFPSVGKAVPAKLQVEKMTLESPTDMVIYRSRLNAKINRNFEVFTATDFLAPILQ